MKVKKRLKHTLSTKQSRAIKAGLFIFIFACLGLVLLRASHAASPYASVGANQGNLSGAACKVSDSNAQNNPAVQFGGSACSPVGSNPINLNPYSSFTVNGNKILDANGNEVYLHGVDRPSLEWSCIGDPVTGGATGIPASDFTTMKNQWNANSVRIALNQDFWLSGAAKYCSSYQSTVNTVIQNARAAGLIVILDLHWSDAGNLQNTTTVGQQCMPDQNSVTFWQQVASLYKSDPAIWFELYNEPYPHNWSVWQNGGSVTCQTLTNPSTVTFQSVGMQQLYNNVRSVAPNNVILAGGDYSASHLDGVPVLTATNLAYAAHIYANRTTPDVWSNSDWDNRFGNLAATHAVVATEFGDLQCGNTTYDQAILNYFRAHNVGYTAWAWYAGGCSFPALITDANGTCDAMGCVTKADMLSYKIPTSSLSLNPSTITSGQSITINWSSSDAIACDKSWTTDTSTVGTQSIKPSASTTFNMICTGFGGSSTSTTSVIVH